MSMEAWCQERNLHLAEERGGVADCGAKLEGFVVGESGGEGSDDGARGRGGEVGGREEFDAVFGWIGRGIELLLLEGTLVAVVVERWPAGRWLVYAILEGE